MTRAGELGEFLRSRRARVSAERAGLDAGARRRVPGLRREEVARLAHVSADYLVRLEQGRVARPSPVIVEALARALYLDEAERRHLYRLAAAAEPAPERGDGSEVRSGLAAVIAGLDPAPAALLSRRLDLLVLNPAAEWLLGPFGGETNYARLVLFDPAQRTLHADWEESARQTVALLRFAAARHPGDSLLHDLIGELRAASREVTAWWESHDVAEKRHGVKRYRHPVAGAIALHYEALLLPDDGDQLLTLYSRPPRTATPDS